MTTVVSELYTALKAAGVEDSIAIAAAKSVLAIEDKDQLATKADLAELRIAIADLKADLTWKMITTMIAMTAIFSGISAALRYIKP